MPASNQFRHQQYPTLPESVPIFRRLDVTHDTDFDYGRLRSELRVSRVLVVHGTFVGDDPFGIADVMSAAAEKAGPFAAVFQKFAESLRQKIRPLMTQLTADVGNYTAEFCESFQRLVGDSPVVELLEPTWSGQNHHFARADLAVRLLCRLNQLSVDQNQRILLWGHSHAGNAFALLTNLLANDRHSVTRFFEASIDPDLPHWKLARQILQNSPTPHPVARSLMITAFGTPVRYGWDTSGMHSLVNVLHHRPSEATAVPASSTSEGESRQDRDMRDIRTQPLFPPHSVQDMINAKFGDWIQAFAIAGTDTPTPGSIRTTGSLAEFLEASLQPPSVSLDLQWIVSQKLKFLCSRWKTGTRCHTDGINLLVDYQPSGTTHMGLPLEISLLGHGVATSITWLPAHLRLVSEALADTLSPTKGLEQ